MSTANALSGLRRLAHDTARLARNHPRMSLLRNAMTVIASRERSDTDGWIDGVFVNVEAILSDIAELER